MKDSYMFYTDRLNKDYRSVFDQVEMYVGAQGVDENTREEQLSQLLDMFLTAQSAGKPVEKIVGSDVEVFCKAFCSEFGWKNRLYSILDRLKSMAVTVLVFCGLDLLAAGAMMASGDGMDVWQEISRGNVSGYLVGILIGEAAGVISSLLVRMLMFRAKRVSMKLLKGISYTVACVTFVLSVMAMLKTNGLDLNPVPVWTVILCSGVYLVIYYLFSHKRLKAQKRERVRFGDMVSKEMERTFPAEMEKKFQRANKRSVRRGRGELTLEMFLDKEEKDCRDMERSACVFYLLPPAGTGLMLLLLWLQGEFPCWQDAVLFAGVCLAFTYPIELVLWRLQRKGIVFRRAWIAQKWKELEQTQR